MPIGKLGMWFFLASESMFFIGLLGAFIVLPSAGPQHLLFVKSSAMLSKWLGWGGAMLLVGSSACLMAGAGRWVRWIAVLAAVLFLVVQILQWQALLRHHTYIVRESDQLSVIDGDKTFPLPNSFDVYGTTVADYPAGNGHAAYLPGNGEILQDVNYGPSRNNFFACYFLMTIVHGLHMAIGILVLGWFMVTRRELGSLQIYWHFVNAVGVIGFFTLYFV